MTCDDDNGFNDEAADGGDVNDESEHLDDSETPPRWRPTTVSWRRTG